MKAQLTLRLTIECCRPGEHQEIFLMEYYFAETKLHTAGPGPTDKL